MTRLEPAAGLGRPRSRHAALLSATMLATGLAHSAEAARFGIVVNPVQDPLFAGLAIPDNAATMGMWSGVRYWPLNAIHMSLLPSGKVVSFGAAGGKPDVQNGRTFAIWTPASGLDRNSHVVLPGVRRVNSFCGAQAFMADGSLLIPGGIFEDGNDKGGAILNAAANTVTASAAQLANDRYYSTLLTLPNGQHVIVGGSFPYLGGWADPQGSINNGWMTGMTPEVFDGNRWRSLFGANSRDAFGPDYNRFWYPRAWIAPNGQVFGISSERMWYLDTAGNGSVRTMPFRNAQRDVGNATDAPNVGPNSTAVMYEPGKIIQVGGNAYSNGEGFLSSNRATIIDINGANPVLTETAPMSTGRGWANATVLPTGQVLVTGGSKYNDRGGGDSVYTSETWEPKSGRWSVGASGSVYRGYHSSALLLQNGALVVAGGGAPGPVANENAEFYYPPYLFKPVNGRSALAPRPQILSLTTNRLQYGQSMQFEFGSQNGIAQVVLIGLGQVTHSFNSGQRRYPVAFTRTDETVTLQGPPSGNVAPPGYYQLVAVDQNGVPSPGVIIAVGNVAAPPQSNTPIFGTPAAPGGGTPGDTAGGGGTGPGTGTNPGTGTDPGTGTIPNGGADGITLKAAHSGLCLAVPAGNNNDGTPVSQQACTGSAEQLWKVKAVAGGSTLVNSASGKCLDLSLLKTPGNGSDIHQWGCHGGANQTWTMKSQGSGTSLTSLFDTNLCVDLYGGSMQAGGRAVAWSCHGGANQTFIPGSRFGGGADGTPLRAAHSGLCLAVPAGNDNDGAPVSQQACTGAKQQLWKAKAVAGGSTLVNSASGKCLDLSLMKTPGNGSDIYQWGCHGGANQTWTTKAQGAGTSITSVFNPNLCVDLYGGSMQAGGRAVARACHGGPNQTFSGSALTQ